MRIRLIDPEHGRYEIECSAQDLITLEEAANALTDKYHQSLRNHMNCNMGEMGCTVTPNQSCDEELTFLYGQLAMIHKFLFLARTARTSSVEALTRPAHMKVEEITIGEPGGPQHTYVQGTFAQNSTDAAIVGHLDADSTMILPKITT